MDLRYTAEEIAFRQEVRDFFRANLPEDIGRKVKLGQRLSSDELRRWTRILHARGWATPAWHPDWGGTGWDPIRQYIFKEEMHMFPVPEQLPFNVNMIGPVLIAFGAEEQKRHFLPKIANLDYWFCQGFSEPGSGSDLASLRTTAVRDGDHYVVNGQKLWTSAAHHANWCFLLVRTDSNVKKQAGISYLLMDMNSPGLTVRPVITLDGQREVNEMFLENIRIPVENLVGEENKGWGYGKYLLGHERAGVARVGVSKMRLRRAKELAAKINVRGRPLSEDPGFRQRCAAIEIEVKALEILQLRVASAAATDAHGSADPKAPILKMKGSELQQACNALLLEVGGYDAMEFDSGFVGGAEQPEGGEDWALTLAPNLYFWRHASISGGSNEIQRNITASAVLGL